VPAIPHAVAIVEDARQAIVTPLHDVLRNAGQVESGQASHLDPRATTHVARASAECSEGWPVE